MAPVAAVRAGNPLLHPGERVVRADRRRARPSEPYAWAWFAGLHAPARPRAPETARVIGGPANPPVELVRGEPDSAIYSAFGGYYDTEAKVSRRARRRVHLPDRRRHARFRTRRAPMSGAVMATTVPCLAGDTFGRLRALDPFSDLFGTIALEVPVDAAVGSTQVLIYRTSGRGMGAFRDLHGRAAPADSGRPRQHAPQRASVPRSS